MAHTTPAPAEPAKGTYYYSDMVARYMNARAAEAAAKAAKEEAANDLRALLDFWRADSIECDHGTATYKNYEQTRFDREAAIAAGLDLAPFTTRKAYERLTVA